MWSEFLPFLVKPIWTLSIIWKLIIFQEHVHDWWLLSILDKAVVLLLLDQFCSRCVSLWKDGDTCPRLVIIWLPLVNIWLVKYMRPSQGFWGTGERGGIYFRGTKVKFWGEQIQYWGTGNIRKQIFDFWGTGEQLRISQFISGEQVPPPPWEGLIDMFIMPRRWLLLFFSPVCLNRIYYVYLVDLGL